MGLTIPTAGSVETCWSRTLSSGLALSLIAASNEDLTNGECRRILFTAPAGCLHGKLKPVPLLSSTGECFLPVSKETQASFPLKQHLTITLQHVKKHEMLLLGFRVSGSTSLPTCMKKEQS